MPGGVKRSNNDIRDDTHNNIYKNSNSYSTKITRDYNSNISCLPGCLVNSSNPQTIPQKNRKNLVSDIFNTKSINSFNTSNKRVEKDNKIFGQSNDEKKLIPNPKAHRPNVIRNVFESQISIV